MFIFENMEFLLKFDDTINLNNSMLLAKNNVNIFFFFSRQKDSFYVNKYY